jgi:hypothetical protein
LDVLAENSRESNIYDIETAKYACKVGIHFIDPRFIAVSPNGTVQFRYRSFSFDSLKGKERLQVVDRALEFIADKLGITVDELVAEAKSRMKSY